MREKLLYAEPEKDTDLLVGTFHYDDSKGQHHDADFYIRTTSDDVTDSGRSEREIDFNEQYGDQVTQLYETCQNVTFDELKPSPIF